ncbi:hypothetical protein BLAT2472_110132 [Burkholderia latens]
MRSGGMAFTESVAGSDAIRRRAFGIYVSIAHRSGAQSFNRA